MKVNMAYELNRLILFAYRGIGPIEPMEPIALRAHAGSTIEKGIHKSMKCL